MEDRRRRGAKPGAKPQDVLTRGVPKVDMDTVRPPGSDAAEDAYSAETVVRAVPKELLGGINALRPAKLPAIETPAEVEPEADAEKGDAEPSEDVPPVSAPREPSALERAEPSETQPKESLEDSDEKVEEPAPLKPSQPPAPVGPTSRTSLVVGLGLLAIVAALIVYTQC